MPAEGRDSDCFDHFVEVRLEARCNLPSRYLTIRRYRYDAAFQRMADPAQKPLLGSLHKYRPTTKRNQSFNRLMPIQFDAEPFTPLRQNW